MALQESHNLNNLITGGLETKQFVYLALFDLLIYQYHYLRMKF